MLIAQNLIGTIMSNNNMLESKEISKNFSYIFLGILSIIAIFIRVNGANDYYYHPDEFFIINIAKGNNIGEVLRFSLFETHPPLYYIFLHYWIQISQEMWFVRGLSLLFGIALIPLYYLIGKKLGGEVCGLCVAILVAFSHGAINQSYVARQYTVFLFFISCYFYWYLIWKEKLATSLPLSSKFKFCGFLLALLACLSHFSAIFAIFTIAAYESVFLYKHKKSRNLAYWIAVNIALALIYIIIQYIWRDGNAVLTLQVFYEAYVKNGKISISDLLGLGPSAPIINSYYVVPSHIWVFAILAMAFVVLKRNINIKPIFHLLLIAFALEVFLTASGIYPFLNSRRTIWILLFVVPFSGLVISEFLVMAEEKLQYKNTKIIGVILLALLALLSYDREARFSESGDQGAAVFEYNTISEQEISDVRKYLQNLDNKSLILLGRSDVFLVTSDKQNPYKFMNKQSFNPQSLAVMPYHQSNILFAASYYPSPIEELLKSEKAKNSLNTADNLIFLNTPYMPSLASDLIDCQQLDKKIIDFPYHGEKRTFARKATSHNITALVIVKKQDFFEQVLSPTGKANKCLKQGNL